MSTHQQWVVYPHSIECVPTGRGYVARPIGFDRFNYGVVEPVRTFKSKSAAEKHADKLTFGVNQ